MAALNKVLIIGNVGADPEVRMAASGTKVLRFSVAVNEKWRNRDGQPQEHTQWIPVTAFKGLADVCERFLQKGTMVYIDGRWRTESWDDKDGVKRFFTRVVADKVQFLTGGRLRGESWPGSQDQTAQNPPKTSEPSQGPSGAPQGGYEEEFDDDLPF